MAIVALYPTMQVSTHTQRQCLVSHFYHLKACGVLYITQYIRIPQETFPRFSAQVAVLYQPTNFLNKQLMNIKLQATRPVAPFLQ